MTDSKKDNPLVGIKAPESRTTYSKSFAQVLDLINSTEEVKFKKMLAETGTDYLVWSRHYEQLKNEFNLLWDFFEKIEQQTKGWYCVSPFAHSWKAVGHKPRNGYCFGVTIKKNHKRNAPMSEKSLAITYAVESWGGGIGDEVNLGRNTKIDDKLIGLSACQNKSISEQHEACKELAARVNQYKLSFRLNHKNIGQQTSWLPLEILNQHSLIELAEKLFVLLNKDLLDDAAKEIGTLNQRLISAG